MAPQEMLFIVNPAAQHGLTAKMLPDLRRLMEGIRGIQIELSAGPLHAHDIAAQAIGFDTIIAVGGDGTVHEVINGIMANPARPTFGVIPTGSGNDYARTLGMSDDLPKAVGQLVSAPVRSLDLGMCNGVWFAESIAIGLDARVTARAVQLKLRSKMIGVPLYFKALLQVMRDEYHSDHITIACDNEPAFECDLLALAVTNGRTYGGGFIITPDAVPDDGLFDVCRIDGMPKHEAFARLPFVVVGKHTHMGPVHMSRAKRLLIHSDVPLAGQRDGEVFIASDFDIRIEPAALNVIAPAIAENGAS